MTRYYVQDASTNAWLGPYEDIQIRGWLDARQLEPTRLLCADEAGATVILAGNLPKPNLPTAPASDAFKAFAVLGLAVAGGAALGAAIAALLAPSRPQRRYTPRLPAYVPPSDPECAFILRRARYHARRGAEVRVDLAGFSRPPVLNGSVPDVHADYGDRVVIEEVENDHSVSSSHARGQDANFSQWAARSRRREYTQFVVQGGRGGRVY